MFTELQNDHRIEIEAALANAKKGKIIIQQINVVLNEQINHMEKSICIFQEANVALIELTDELKVAFAVSEMEKSKLLKM